MTITRCLLLSLASLTWIASAAAAQRIYCDSAQFNSLTNAWKPQADENTRESAPVIWPGPRPCAFWWRS